MEAKVEIPNPPSFPGFGAAEQKEWKETYAEAFQQAQIDHREDPTEQQQAALREANRMVKVPEVKNYNQAMSLPVHHLLHDSEGPIRREVGDQLIVKTADGKKYSFPVPKSASADAPKAEKTKAAK